MVYQHSACEPCTQRDKLTLTLTLIIVYLDNSTLNQTIFSTFKLDTNTFDVECYGDHIKTYIHVDITRPPQLSAQTQLLIDDNIVLRLLSFQVQV